MNYTLHLPPGYQPVPLPGLTPWLAALRSGEHKQGRNRLGKPDGPKCCLGVLCYVQGRLTADGQDDENGKFAYLSPGNPAYGPLVDGYCLPSNTGVEFGGHTLSELSALNDRGIPFSDIADILEKVYIDAP